MKTKYPTAPLHNERLDIVLPAKLKRRLFETAARRGLPAAMVVREALAATLDAHRAA
jgi:predicted DNA-binding protein